MPIPENPATPTAPPTSSPDPASTAPAPAPVNQTPPTPATPAATSAPPTPATPAAPAQPADPFADVFRTSPEDGGGTPEASEPTSEATPPPDSTQADQSFLDAVRGLGPGMEDVESEEDAQLRVIEAVRQYNDERANLRQQLYEQQQQFQFAQWQYQQQLYQQQLAEQQAGQPNPESAAPQEDPFWKLPELDSRQVSQYREIDPATQEERWKPDTPIAIRTAAEQHQQQLLNYQHELLYNPDGFRSKLDQRIEQRAKDIAQAAITEFQQSQQQQQVQQQQEEYYSSFMTKNNWMFQADPLTREVTRGTDGAPLFSHQGQEVLGIVQELESKGLRDPQALWDTAISVYQSKNPPHQAQPTQPPQPTPAEIAEQRRKDLLVRGARSMPNRGATLETPNATGAQPPQNPMLNHRERLFDRLSQVAGLN